MVQQLIEALFPPQCAACGDVGSGLCLRCVPEAEPLHSRLPTLDVDALGAYDGSLRRAVLALKSGRRDVAKAFAGRLRSLAGNALLVPVPTTRARRRVRGFDGCVLVAALISQEGSATIVAGLDQIAGDSQRGRSRGARLSAIRRFRWRGEPLNGMPVVLLDDVVTTGATLEDCARAVRDAGGIVERAIAVALA